MSASKKESKKEKGYLSNKEMYEELIRCQRQNKISDKLGHMFMIIAKKYSSKPKFSGYSYKDEMVSSGILACCAALQKFDSMRSDSPNPFAYYTAIIHNAFIQYLNREKKQQKIRDKLLIENGLNPSCGYQDDVQLNDNENSESNGSDSIDEE